MTNPIESPSHFVDTEASSMMGSSKIARGVLTTLVTLLILIINSQARQSTSTFTITKPIMNNNNECINGDDKLAFLGDLRNKYADQPTFLQAVEEMALNLLPLFYDADKGAFYQRAFLALAEPERIISFRVPWEDDDGNIQYNRGWRVEFSSVLGPYKGGLRFHKTVNEDILKFLGFEQIFKNALTNLPMGGGKGGSDFDPKGKSEAEVRRFCQSFMTELYRYLGPNRDVPAGDIGVGGREIGYMLGQYKRIVNLHGTGVLTGKNILTGGSPLRPEATGFGLVYMTEIAVKDKLDRSLEGMRAAVSGSGNVAQHAAEKLLQLGAKVITMSDSNGVLVFDDGMTEDDWDAIVDCKQVKRGRLSSLDGKVSGRYVANETPWSVNVKYDLALPCATQNELDEDGVALLIKNGVLGIFEGANLPTHTAGQEIIRENPDVIYVPGKASNAGGVGVSGLEMAQNAQHLTWTEEEVDEKLQSMMADIYKQMQDAGKDDSLEAGANRAGFLKVAAAMKHLGYIW